MVQNREGELDLITPDMIIAHQRLHELRQEAENRRTQQPETGGWLASRIRTLLRRE